MVASMLVFSSLKITDVLKQCTIEIALNLDLPQCGIGSRSNRSAQRPGCLGGSDHYVGQLHCRTGLRIDLSHGR